MSEGRVRRVALLGGESSGKTTLAQALAAALGTAWVPEYGRELWLQFERTLTIDELVAVARRQVALEDAAAARLHHGEWLVCDTTPLTTLQYALHDHGAAPPELHALAQRRYDLTVLCAPDFGFVQDGARRDEGFRAQQHTWTLARLAEQGVQPLVALGAVDARLQRVRAALQTAGAAAPLGSQ